DPESACSVITQAGAETRIYAEFGPEIAGELQVIQDQDQGGSVIRSSPPGINCDSYQARHVGGLASFAPGTVVTLTVTLDLGDGGRAVFTGWGGACTNTSP